MILVIFFLRHPEGPPISPLPEVSVPLLSEPQTCDIVDHTDKLTLPFQQEACGSSQLVGGKGSQLALLTSIQIKVHLCAMLLYDDQDPRL